MESQRRAREYFVQPLPTLRPEVISMIGAIAALISLFYALQLPVCIVAVLNIRARPPSAWASALSDPAVPESAHCTVCIILPAKNGLH